ncbi:hypothetical protein SDC9_132945 [bioreactor metagenome]|uniref:Uncharacterized protein n=1 Tax=bioreactor metagenome TaxID=1076179 RepID=A0A645DBB6_9ZZZZ
MHVFGIAEEDQLIVDVFFRDRRVRVRKHRDDVRAAAGRNLPDIASPECGCAEARRHAIDRSCGHGLRITAVRFVDQKCAAHDLKKVIDITVAAEADADARAEQLGNGGNAAANLAVGERHAHRGGAACGKQRNFFRRNLHHLRGEYIRVETA